MSNFIELGDKKYTSLDATKIITIEPHDDLTYSDIRIIINKSINLFYFDSKDRDNDLERIKEFRNEP